MSLNTPLINPKEVDALLGVKSHFQADQDFNKDHSSCEDSDALVELSSVCLNFATNVSEASGLGTLNRVVAYDEDAKFILFGLQPQSKPESGPVIMGVIAASDADADALVTSINQLS